jgi:DNA modification methylase
LKRYGDEVDGEIGHGQSLDEYLADMRTVFTECHQLVKPTGAMWVVVDTLRFPTRTEKEHELLPTVLQWIAEGRGEVETPSGARPRARVRKTAAPR